MANTARYAWLHFGAGVDWKDVSKALLLQLNALGRKRREIITVTSGFRSNAEQKVLYDRYIKSGKNIKYIAAPPGQSMHNKGLAVDATIGGVALSKVVSAKQLEAFGLTAPVKGDPVHIQLIAHTTDTAAPSTPPTASTGTSEGAAALPDYTGNLPTTGTTSGPPDVLLPGSVPAQGYTSRQIAETWRLIATQPGASKDTLDYASLLTGSTSP